MMRKTLTVMFTTLCLFSLNVSAKSADIDLSRLDISDLLVTKKRSNISKKVLLKKPPKKALKKVKLRSYPDNCLRWSKKSLRRKAKPYDRTINKYARLYNVDGNLVRAIISIESCFKPKALSHAGAQGLMQLMPGTAKRFGVSNSYNSKQNIRGGTKYLKFLLKRYRGDLDKVLAAYNAGEGNVDKYKGIPPFKETQNYVKSVLKNYLSLSHIIRKGYHLPTGKPGRYGLRHNRRLAPHLYKKR